jgi:hypothetical protein
MAASQKLTQQLTQMTAALEKSNRSANIIEVAKIMDRFSDSIDNLDAKEAVVSSAMNDVTIGMIPQNEVCAF